MSQWHVRESGEPGAPAVVLLHGAGLSGGMWRDHMARLSAFHCLAPDFPGCGMSNRLQWTSSADAADYIANLIATRIPAGHAHVVGISLGGAVAHTLLAHHARVLDRVIIDGAGILPWWGNGPYLLFIAAIAPFLHTSAVIGALSRSVGGIPEPDQAEFKRASRLAFLKSLADARGTRATRTEIRAARPTLLVAGEKETAVRRSNAALAAVMPRAVARYVAGFGHGWLGTRMKLHLDMVEAWLTTEESAAGLVAEGPSPAAVSALLRGLRRAE
ncbi:MAG TPA: alpha/beta fold hydrolase [Candidatus Limnocylindria bacterium]|nr:alpha/beta fold hydrolase [Candidatus Limnocylindria bacterium]